MALCEVAQELIEEAIKGVRGAQVVSTRAVEVRTDPEPLPGDPRQLTMFR